MAVLLFAPPSADRPHVIDAVHEAGHEVSVIETAAHAYSMIGRDRLDFIIVDLAGHEAIRFLRRRRPPCAESVPCICVADRRQPDVSAEALRLGVADIVARPLRQDDLVAALANASEIRLVGRRHDDAVEPIEAGEGVFGASPAMRDVLTIVRRVAPSRCAVLIIGERGTGREMVARAIHLQGRAGSRPFVRILGPDPRSAELEQVLDGGVAPGSTVYLEEVEELPMDAQVRLEDRMRGAGTREPPPVRFIASSQPRITEWMDRGLVRRGLIETLGVVRIDLPPLRQRSQDVPLLATHFLKTACHGADLPAKTFSRSALTLLTALPWAGNASELRSLCERLVVLVPRGVILLEDLVANVRLDGAEAMGRPRETLREARERFERDYVTSVLQHHRGRMGEAARDLGIERTNLYRKIKQLNIRWTIPE